MEQTALANKPDIATAVPDNLSDPADELAIAIIAVMSKAPRGRIKSVQAAVEGTKPKITPMASCDARNPRTADTIRVVGVMKIANTAFGGRVEFVHPSVSGNPEVAVLVL